MRVTMCVCAFALDFCIELKLWSIRFSIDNVFECVCVFLLKSSTISASVTDTPSFASLFWLVHRRLDFNSQFSFQHWFHIYTKQAQTAPVHFNGKNVACFRTNTEVSPSNRNIDISNTENCTFCNRVECLRSGENDEEMWKCTACMFKQGKTNRYQANII